MITPLEVAWLAGLFEGEGCFYSHSNGHGYPQMTINMTDKDVINKAAKLMKVDTIMAKNPRNENWNTNYGFTLGGIKAIEWMLTLYTLMGERRQKKIEEVIHKWKLYTPHKSLTTEQKQSIATRATKEKLSNIATEFGISIKYVLQIRRSIFGLVHER